jgi:hypothetical protein
MIGRRPEPSPFQALVLNSLVERRFPAVLAVTTARKLMRPELRLEEALNGQDLQDPFGGTLIRARGGQGVQFAQGVWSGLGSGG